MAAPKKNPAGSKCCSAGAFSVFVPQKSTSDRFPRMTASTRAAG